MEQFLFGFGIGIGIGSGLILTALIVLFVCSLFPKKQ